MIIGHKKQLAYLKRMLDSERIPHAFLFSGGERLGKKRVAIEFISWIFKESPLSHPDFILLEPEGKEIQIGQVRELSTRLSLKPVKSRKKAVIIDRADSMNPRAQNSFLKTLEEPMGDALVILVSDKPHFLLPTIVSRCQNIRFYPPGREEISEYLREEKGLREEKIEEILEISQGRPGLALELAASKESLDLYQKEIRELDKLSRSSIATRFRYAKELSKREDLEGVLRIWLNQLRNLFIKKCLEPAGANIEYLKDLLQGVEETIYLISATNVNKRLALETLMMKFNK